MWSGKPASGSGSPATCRAWPAGCRRASESGLWSGPPAPACKSPVSVLAVPRGCKRRRAGHSCEERYWRRAPRSSAWAACTSARATRGTRVLGC